MANGAFGMRDLYAAYPKFPAFGQLMKVHS